MFFHIFRVLDDWVLQNRCALLLGREVLKAVMAAFRPGSRATCGTKSCREGPAMHEAERRFMGYFHYFASLQKLQKSIQIISSPYNTGVLSHPKSAHAPRIELNENNPQYNVICSCQTQVNSTTHDMTLKSNRSPLFDRHQSHFLNPLLTHSRAIRCASTIC